ncbi:vacuolar protein-sorting-associated protein 37 homolog 1-like [Papaver somniferum]|uniref:vacuolar protein-sorting-associated protein 37 homolog 1-like n=1 Tax=Papaver somniferum TaxID=3469 RepID=UPI000E705A87|nr:vacuolar protein-sorting-associated protein 37 homolog 1-like [Papaver somniferum]
MFKFWGSQEPQEPPPPPRVQGGPGQTSWYPPSVVSSSNSSRPSTPGGGSSLSSFNMQQRPSSDRPQSQSQTQLSPAEAAGIIYQLKDKSVDELRRLLTDREAYNQFLFSLDQVKTQNNLRDELRKETLQLARQNIENEPRIVELRNQCRIIRTTELAAAEERLNELERQKEETLKFYSPVTLLQKVLDAANKTDEESEVLHKQLLEKEIDLSSFIQKYKKLRTSHHKHSLTHLAAKTTCL